MSNQDKKTKEEEKNECIHCKLGVVICRDHPKDNNEYSIIKEVRFPGGKVKLPDGYKGNFQIELDSNPSNTSWDEAFDKLEVTYPKLGLREEFTEHLLLDENIEKVIKSFIHSTVEPMIREQAYIEGQKHAFGVDKERVRKEERGELIKELDNMKNPFASLNMSQEAINRANEWEQIRSIFIKKLSPTKE